MKRLSVTAALVAFAGFGIAAPAAAQQVGAHVNWADDADLGIGARVQGDLGSMLGHSGNDPLTGLKGVASFDYYFWDCPAESCTYLELNGNALYPLDLGEESFVPYVGGGLVIAYARMSTEGVSVSDTDPGLNVVGGADFALGDLGAFTEAKFEIGGGDQFVLTFGLLFGGGG